MYRSYLTEFVPTIFTTEEFELEYESVSALKMHFCALSLRELTPEVEGGLKVGVRSKEKIYLIGLQGLKS